MLPRSTGASAYPSGVELPEPWASVLIVAAIVLAALGCALAWDARRRQVRTQANFEALWGDQKPADGGDLSEVLAGQTAAIEAERDRIDELVSTLAQVHDELAQTLQHVAVVRYDAFGDMGGRLSFSIAVVDDRGDGLVLSSIHARGESRSYAKGIIGGDSEVTLTPEERQALSAARDTD